MGDLYIGDLYIGDLYMGDLYKNRVKNVTFTGKNFTSILLY